MLTVICHTTFKFAVKRFTNLWGVCVKVCSATKLTHPAPADAGQHCFWFQVKILL